MNKNTHKILAACLKKGKDKKMGCSKNCSPMIFVNNEVPLDCPVRKLNFLTLHQK